MPNNFKKLNVLNTQYFKSFCGICNLVLSNLTPQKHSWQRMMIAYSTTNWNAVGMPESIDKSLPFNIKKHVNVSKERSYIKLKIKMI